jgi:hypothetical protein
LERYGKRQSVMKVDIAPHDLLIVLTVTVKYSGYVRVRLVCGHFDVTAVSTQHVYCVCN